MAPRQDRPVSHPPDLAAEQAAGDLLSPALLARLERLQLSTRRRLAGRFSGEHRSPRHGTSLDFADYREYHPGDDFRRIDYHLYARLDVLALKLFEAEDDLTVRLLVDTSTSMAAGEPTKLRTAARVAAALGFVALVRRDVVTLYTFPQKRVAPRFVGRGATGPLFARLAGLTPGGDTQFAAAAADLLARPGPPGLTVLVSDLLAPDWDVAIRRLPARGGDLVVVHVLDPTELRPDLVGDLDLVDSETGERVAVSLSHDSLAAYQQLVASWIEEVAGRCRRAGAAYVLLLTTDSLEDALLGLWRTEGVVR